jgi:chromosome segregation ATPase
MFQRDLLGKKLSPGSAYARQRTRAFNEGARRLLGDQAPARINAKGKRKPNGFGGRAKDMPANSTKYKVDPNPLDLEKDNPNMQPQPEEEAKELRRWIKKKILDLDTKINKLPPAEKFRVDILKRERSTWKTHLGNLKLKNAVPEVRKEFIQDFQNWLLGRGKEADHLKTPWYRVPNKDPSVLNYLDAFVNERHRFLAALAKLQQRTPNNVDEAFLYFKYIVRQDPTKLPVNTFLADWDKFSPLMESEWEASWREPDHDQFLPRDKGIPGRQQHLNSGQYQKAVIRHSKIGPFPDMPVPVQRADGNGRVTTDDGRALKGRVVVPGRTPLSSSELERVKVLNKGKPEDIEEHLARYNYLGNDKTKLSTWGYWTAHEGGQRLGTGPVVLAPDSDPDDDSDNDGDMDWNNTQTPRNHLPDPPPDQRDDDDDSVPGTPPSGYEPPPYVPSQNISSGTPPTQPTTETPPTQPADVPLDTAALLARLTALGEKPPKDIKRRKVQRFFKQSGAGKALKNDIQQRLESGDTLDQIYEHYYNTFQTELDEGKPLVESEIPGIADLREQYHTKFFPPGNKYGIDINVSDQEQHVNAILRQVAVERAGAKVDSTRLKLEGLKLVGGSKTIRERLRGRKAFQETKEFLRNASQEERTKFLDDVAASAQDIGFATKEQKAAVKGLLTEVVEAWKANNPDQNIPKDVFGALARNINEQWVGHVLETLKDKGSGSAAATLAPDENEWQATIAKIKSEGQQALAAKEEELGKALQAKNTLEEKVATYDAQLVALGLEKTEIGQKLSDAFRTNAALTSQVQQLESGKQALQGQVDGLKGLNSANAAKTVSLEARIKALNEWIDDLQKNKGASDLDHANLNKTLREQRDQIDELKNILKAEKDSLTKLKDENEKNAKSSKEYKRLLEEQKEMHKKEIETMNEQAKKMKTEYAKVLRKWAADKKRVEIQENKIKELDESVLKFSEATKNAGATVRRLEGELSEKDKQLEASQQREEVLLNTNQYLSKEQQETKKVFDALALGYEEQVDKLQKDKEEAEEGRQAFLEQLAEKTEQVEALEEEIAELQDKLNVAGYDASEALAIQQSEYNQGRKALENQIAQLQAKQEESEANHNGIVAEYQGQLLAEQKVAAQLRADIAELDRVGGEGIVELQKRLGESDSRAAALEQELIKTQQDASEIERRWQERHNIALDQLKAALTEELNFVKRKALKLHRGKALVKDKATKTINQLAFEKQEAVQSANEYEQALSKVASDKLAYEKAYNTLVKQREQYEQKIAILNKQRQLDAQEKASAIQKLEIERDQAFAEYEQTISALGSQTLSARAKVGTLTQTTHYLSQQHQVKSQELQEAKQSTENLSRGYEQIIQENESKIQVLLEEKEQLYDELGVARYDSAEYEAILEQKKQKITHLRNDIAELAATSAHFAEKLLNLRREGVQNIGTLNEIDYNTLQPYY